MMATVEKIKKMKENVKYQFDCDMTEAYKDEDNCDEWGCASVWVDDIGVEYNFCIDNGENCCAIYKTEIGDNGYMETDCSTFTHYEIDFDNENWKEELENAMCEALIEFFYL